MFYLVNIVKKIFVFDSDNIEYLDDQHAINEYAWVHDSIAPAVTKPPSQKLVLNDRIVPTQRELQIAHDKNIPVHQIVERFDSQVNRDCFDPEIASESADFVAIHGGNDLVNMHGYLSPRDRCANLYN